MTLKPTEADYTSTALITVVTNEQDKLNANGRARMLEFGGELREIAGQPTHADRSRVSIIVVGRHLISNVHLSGRTASWNTADDDTRAVEINLNARVDSLQTFWKP